jgi:hypothetical protein
MSLSVSFVEAIGKLSLNKKSKYGLKRRHLEECQQILKSTKDLLRNPPCDYLTLSNHIKYVETVFNKIIDENSPSKRYPLLVEIEYWLYVRNTFGCESSFLCELEKIEHMLTKIISDCNGDV